MTAKEYLRQIGTLDAKINRRMKQVEELKALVTSTGSLTPGDKVQSSPSGDKMSGIVIKWIDMEHEVTAMIDELIDLKNQIIGEIHQLDDVRYIRILEMRYIDQETFEQIAVTMHMDIRHIFRLHGYALQEFAQRILS
jgi:DNA-directed RNA polymerase specialized sigma subunit